MPNRFIPLDLLIEGSCSNNVIFNIAYEMLKFALKPRVALRSCVTLLFQKINRSISVAKMTQITK